MTAHAPASAHHGRRDAFRWPVRIYFEDTDAGGVVYYGNYLSYLERARTEWLRHHGFELPVAAGFHSYLFVVRAVDIEYLKPARLNDALEVSVEIADRGRTWIAVFQRVLRGHELLAKARVRVVCVDTQSIRPARIPQVVLDRLTAHKLEQET
jgi:acyl-CoA thioester hydrolase